MLKRFDFVVASNRGRFKLDRKMQTQRLFKAIFDLHFAIIGHMNERQLQRRPSYAIDVENVLRACAKHDVVVEINGPPWRLDLDWRWYQAALEFGCMMSINPDAHSTPELVRPLCHYTFKTTPLRFFEELRAKAFAVRLNAMSL